jgi:hypothetical protein
METTQFTLTDFELKTGKALRDYLSTTGMTQAEFVSRHDLNKGYVNAISLEKKMDLKGVLYPKIQHYKKIARLIGMEDNAYWLHMDTPYFLGIQSTCQKAQAEKELRIIDGQYGYGKTYSLQNFWNANTQVAFVKMMKKWSKRTFLHEIAKSLNIKKYEKYSLSGIQDEIVKALTAEDTNWLLILDEMEQASKAMWTGVIKDLIDDTQNGSHERLCGLLISGSGIKQKVDKWTTTKTAKEGANQLEDRLFGSWQILPSLTGDKISKGLWNKIIEEALDNAGIEIDDKTAVINWLSQLDSLRKLSKTVVRACQQSAKKNEPISINMLDMLFGKEMSYGE